PDRERSGGSTWPSRVRRRPSGLTHLDRELNLKGTLPRSVSPALRAAAARQRSVGAARWGVLLCALLAFLWGGVASAQTVGAHTTYPTAVDPRLEEAAPRPAPPSAVQPSAVQPSAVQPSAA